MTTKHHTTNDKLPRFEDAYRRAPFAELIRMVLMATDAVVGQLGRTVARGAAPAGRAER